MKALKILGIAFGILLLLTGAGLAVLALGKKQPVPVAPGPVYPTGPPQQPPGQPYPPQQYPPER
jgi:hypothetical protein